MSNSSFCVMIVTHVHYPSILPIYLRYIRRFTPFHTALTFTLRCPVARMLVLHHLA